MRGIGHFCLAILKYYKLSLVYKIGWVFLKYFFMDPAVVLLLSIVVSLTCTVEFLFGELAVGGWQ